MRYEVQSILREGDAPELVGQTDDQGVALRDMMLPLLAARTHHRVYQVDTMPHLQVKPQPTQAEREALRKLLPKTMDGDLPELPGQETRA